MVCFILHHVAVDETDSHKHSDISSADAGTFEFVHKRLTRVWLHDANAPYMVLVFWHVFRRMLKHTTISAPFDFDNKDRAPNSFVTQRNTAFRRCFLTLFPQGTHHVDAQEVPYADRLSNAGRAVLSAFR